MKKVISFRAWDKTTKNMYFGYVLGANHFGKVIDNSIGGPEVLEAKRIDDNLVIMQWTGVSDRYDKDIYEGDTVELNHKDKCLNGCCRFNKYTQKYRRTVMFQNGKFNINPHNANTTVVVIGNIFQHPKL